MKAQGIEVRIDPQADRVFFDLDEWHQPQGQFGLMMHGPSGLKFFVDLPNAESRNPDKHVTAFEFRARVVGGDCPNEEVQEFLGRSAIASFLIMNKLWNPEVRQVLPNRPAFVIERSEKQYIH